jgi:hypothetical protein
MVCTLPKPHPQSLNQILQSFLEKQPLSSDFIDPQLQETRKEPLLAKELDFKPESCKS